MRALVCLCVYDMILLGPEYLGFILIGDWFGSHVRSNPLPIEFVPDRLSSIARAYA